IAGSGNASPQNLQEVATQASALAQGAPDVFTALLANETAKKDPEVLKSIVMSQKATDIQLKQIFSSSVKKTDKNLGQDIVKQAEQSKYHPFFWHSVANRNKIKFALALLMVLVGGPIVILSCGFSSPQIIFGIAYLSCQILIQFGVYGLDELIPDTWWYQNIISPLFLIGASALLMFAMMTLMPTLMVSQMWWLMLPVGISCLVKFVIQIISTMNGYDMDNRPSSPFITFLEILPVLTIMIGILLTIALYAQAFHLLAPHFILALMGYCIVTQVVIYAFDVIPNDNIRVCLQVAATICMSAGLVFGMMAWLPTVPIWTVITTVALSALVRVSKSQKQLRGDHQLFNGKNNIDNKERSTSFNEKRDNQSNSSVNNDENSGGGNSTASLKCR
ncbi:hypothetical protein N9Y17_04200, partial [Gammaproteobacteria bacterium]|nr:hypothetical protein [Gammaproteobacteria bacterium]